MMFISAGPDQRRTESSDSSGNVRGSYTFLDDKGVQRTVHYIAGPGIGYRIVKNNKDPYIPSFFPTIPSAYDPDFVNTGATAFSPDDSGTDDVFKGPDGTAASGHVKPPPFSTTDKDRPSKKPSSGSSSGGGSEEDIPGDSGFSQGSSFGGAGSNEDVGYVDEDASSFGGGSGSGTGGAVGTKPTKGPGDQ